MGSPSLQVMVGAQLIAPIALAGDGRGAIDCAHRASRAQLIASIWGRGARSRAQSIAPLPSPR